MTIGVVIQVGPGRVHNLEACLQHLLIQTRYPDELVIVCDGPDAFHEVHDAAMAQDWWHTYGCKIVSVPKWEAGHEQLRNVGAKSLRSDIVWFVDSDIILEPEACEAVTDTWLPGYIVIAPYDWLGPNARARDPKIRNDPRWPRFEEPTRDWVGDVSAGLSCFGGNLAWDRIAFGHIGGFWDQIHRGEDGELGLRAVEAGIPMRYAPAARGYHLWHPVNLERIYEENARNVPMIDGRHWRILGGDHFELTSVDGASLAQTCPRCHEQIPCNGYWGHTCPPS